MAAPRVAGVKAMASAPPSINGSQFCVHRLEPLSLCNACCRPLPTTMFPQTSSNPRASRHTDAASYPSAPCKHQPCRWSCCRREGLPLQANPPVTSGGHLSINLTASPIVRIAFASASGISQPNSSSECHHQIDLVQALRRQVIAEIRSHQWTLLASTPRRSTTTLLSPVLRCRSSASPSILCKHHGYPLPVGVHKSRYAGLLWLRLSCDPDSRGGQRWRWRWS